MMGDRTPTADRQDTGSHDRQPVTVAAAADRLGITPDAVRGRLHRGTLLGEKVGTEWRVFLPQMGEATADRQDPTAAQQSPTAGRQGTTGVRQDTDRADAAALVALVADLARRNEELAAAAGMWQTRAAHLEVQLKQLTVGDDGDGDPSSSSPATPGGTETPEPGSDAPAPWWRFWRRG